MLIYILNFAFIINALVIPQLHSEASIASVNRIPHQTTNAHKEYPILCKKGFLDCLKPLLEHQTNVETENSRNIQAATESATENQYSKYFKSIYEQPYEYMADALLYPLDSNIELIFEELKKLDTKKNKFGDFFAKYNEAKLKWIARVHDDDFSGKSIKIRDMDFQLLKNLGQGAFGVAYLAKTPSLNENVVVKFTKLKSQMSSDHIQFLIDSYIREKEALQITNRLIYFDDEFFVTVQKEIKGENLSKFLEFLLKFRVTRSQMKYVDLAEKYDKLVDEFMDKYGLIHGDVAPRNVIMDLNGDLHLIDFGMSHGVTPENNVKALIESRMQSQKEWDLLLGILYQIEVSLIFGKEKTKPITI